MEPTQPPQTSLYSDAEPSVKPKPKRRLTLKIVVTLLILAILAGGGYVIYRILNQSKADVGVSSGLMWPSGVHAANEMSPNVQFGNWRGRPIDVIHVFTDRSSWGSLMNPAYFLDQNRSFFNDRNHIFVMSQPLWPEGQGNVAQCAAGAYNNNWRQFGTTLTNNGLNHRNMVVRIAWEYNGTFMYYRPDVPVNPSEAQLDAAFASWRQCWRNVAQSIKATAPGIRTDWTINGHGSQAYPLSRQGNVVWYNAYRTYPGNDVVDIVGIDDYDMFPPIANDADFTSRCNWQDGGGMCDVAQFARNHGKQFAVGEWSITGRCSGAYNQGQGGGDNPLYIRRMAQEFYKNRDIMAYEAYYDDPAPGNVCSALMRKNNDGSSNSASAAEYMKWFGTNSPYGGNGVSYYDDTTATLTNRILTRPDGRSYYVANKQSRYIGNVPLRDCISGRNGAGEGLRVTDRTLNAYSEVQAAWCPYENTPGANFVREANDSKVWLVLPNAEKRHVGVLCTTQPDTTPILKYRVWVVPEGETAGHRNIGTWQGTPQTCAALRG